MGTGWLGVPRDWVASLGAITRFSGEVVGDIGNGRVFRFFGEALRQAGILILGSALVIWGMVFILGLQCGIEGAYFNRSVGAPAYAGVFSAWCDLREMVPYMFGYIMSAKVGTGIVAELGAMRINEEIDALEVMGVRPVTFLASTRLVAAWLVLPFIYAAAVGVAFLASYIAVVQQIGEVSSGGYSLIFWMFQNPPDFLYSVIKGMTMATAIVLVGCYYGYTASGGPVGVGQATAKSMILNMVLVHLIGMLGSQVFWGANPRATIGGGLRLGRLRAPRRSAPARLPPPPARRRPACRRCGIRACPRSARSGRAPRRSAGSSCRPRRATALRAHAPRASATLRPPSSWRGAGPSGRAVAGSAPPDPGPGARRSSPAPGVRPGGLRPRSPDRRPPRAHRRAARGHGPPPAVRRAARRARPPPWPAGRLPSCRRAPGPPLRSPGPRSSSGGTSDTAPRPHRASRRTRPPARQPRGRSRNVSATGRHRPRSMRCVATAACRRRQAGALRSARARRARAGPPRQPAARCRKEDRLGPSRPRRVRRTT